MKVISESYNYIGAERLQPNLVGMADQLAAHGELRLTAEVQQQLGQTGLSSVRWVVTRLQQDQPRLP